MEYSIKVNKKSIAVKYSNGARKRFRPGQPYHHKTYFKAARGQRWNTNTRFSTRFKKLLDKEWLDEVIGEVTAECYRAIQNAAPHKTGTYKSKILYRSTAANKYLSPDKHIKYGSIYVQDDPLPDGSGTYSDLARFLEFGTRSFEITGAGKASTTKDGKPWGTHPQPHWIPNYEIYKKVLRERIRAEIRKL